MRAEHEREQKEAISYALANMFVQTPNVERVYKSIKFCRMHNEKAKSKASYIHQSIIGEGGTGKTAMLTRYCNRPENNPHIVVVNDERGQEKEIDILPVLYVITPSPFTKGALNERILEALGARIFVNEKIEPSKRRAMNLMKDQGVAVLILDEIQSIAYLTDNGQRDAMEHLKDISNVSKVSVVLSGTENFQEMIEMSPQYRRRYPVIKIEPYKNDDDFIWLLKSIEDQIKAPFPTNLTHPQIAKVLFDISKGYLGILGPFIEAMFYEMGIDDDSVSLSDMIITPSIVRKTYMNRGIYLEEPKKKIAKKK